ncbi:MAG: pyridoxamine 5'-phosphate oxidase family protein [Pseudomonadales bacterium]
MARPDPVTALRDDRRSARERSDPCANLCTVASVDAEGHPHARTLVLRDLGRELAVFGNATSPKWSQMLGGSSVAVVVWLPSLNLQYRLRCTTTAVARDIVHESWQLRPEVPKRLDWFYTHVQPQGTPMQDRETLLAALEALLLPDPLVAPDTAEGRYLRPFVVDRLDLNQPDGVHDRRHFELREGIWQETVLVP